MKVCVLGAGLQGSLCALELAERGVEVVLVEAADSALTGASLHNEGKIHLGYVYAKDLSNRTLGLMARGATQFGRLMHRWWPEHEIEATSSDPFDYLVLPQSLENADWLNHRYTQIDQEISNHLQGGSGSYLGRKDVAPVRRLSPRELELRYDTQNVSAGYHTEERAVDLPRMAKALRGALSAANRIECRWNTVVDRVLRRPDGTFDIRTSDEIIDGPFEHVVNTLWWDRLRVDATLGIEARRPVLFRQKVANRMLLPEPQPQSRSATMVIGPFGDFVTFPDGSCYLSWYPANCIRRTSAITIPDDWHHPPEALLSSGFDSAVEELSRRIQGVDMLARSATEKSSNPGVIVSWGITDVDDPDSELHRRFDVGLSTPLPGYHSIDTGKLTLAPIFAEELAERITS